MNKTNKKDTEEMWKAIRKVVGHRPDYANVKSYKIPNTGFLSRLEIILQILFTGTAEQLEVWDSNFSGTTPMIIKCSHPDHILCSQCGQMVEYANKYNGLDTPNIKIYDS